MNPLKTFQKPQLEQVLQGRALNAFKLILKKEFVENGPDLFVGGVSGEPFGLKSRESTKIFIFAKKKDQALELIHFALNFMGEITSFKILKPEEIIDWHELDIKGKMFKSVDSNNERFESERLKSQVFALSSL